MYVAYSWQCAVNESFPIFNYNCSNIFLCTSSNFEMLKHILITS